MRALGVMLVALNLVQLPVPGAVHVGAPPASIDALCQAVETPLTLSVGESFEAVVFVDGTHTDYFRPESPYVVPTRYQEIWIWVYPPCCGVMVSPLRRNVTDTTPVCPSGTAHAGLRPHVIPLPPFLTPATYVIQAQWIDRSFDDGTFLEDQALARYYGFTPSFSVVVK